MKATMKSLSLIAILAMAQLVSAVDIFGGGDITDGHFEERLVSASHRELTGTCDGVVENHYFEVSIEVQPAGDVLGWCSIEDQILLGHAINLMLLDYGIGEARADDEAIFLAGVCPQPTTSNRRKLGFVPSFMWLGAGGCRGCFGDDNDMRALQGNVRGTMHSISGTNLWFTQTFAPQLEITVENAIKQEIAPNYQHCLGSSPVASVEIIKVSLQDLEFQCDGERVMGQLASMSLADVPLQNFQCGKCVSIDFSTRGDGRVLLKGDYVKNEWKTQYGLTVTANGGYSPNQKARILDTADNECINKAGSNEFGSPNRNCNNGGIGQGDGGTPGQDGENCVSVGNVLVIQESSKACPDSSQSGGNLTLSFDNPVLLSDIGMMDVDEADQRMIVTYADGYSETFTYAGFGDNAAQRVLCSKLNVKKVEVIFPGSAAITEINFCPECIPQMQHDDDHHCLVAGEKIIKSTVQIAFDDFENPNEDLALKAWEKGRVDATGIGNHTKFLGRYVFDVESPYKTFSVPWKAETIIFDLDFYELENWDLGLDPLKIFVDGEVIGLTNVFTRDNEDHLEGTSTIGIRWVCVSSGPSDARKHHFTIQVPKISRLFNDGKLRLKLDAGSNQNGKSAGWDNVKVTARYGCAKGNSKKATSTSLHDQSCDSASAVQVAFEDFEGSNAGDGWSDFNLEDDQINLKNFTKFMGWYGKGDWHPKKEFIVPITAQTIILEVDFYEIDCWDGTAKDNPDTAFIHINREIIDLGVFKYSQDEGRHVGITQGGISWVMTSLTQPANLGGFNIACQDQKHQVIIEIPAASRLYNRDGKLRVELKTRVETEKSRGWDNLKISAKIDCSPPSCSSALAKQVTLEDFEEDNAGDGWSEFELEDSGIEYFTKFLGRYGEGDNSPKKEFIVPKIAQIVFLEVDFYEIGDWDGSAEDIPDTALVHIANEIIDLGAFRRKQDEGSRSGVTTGGVSWVVMTSLIQAANLGPYSDQKHHVLIEIPAASGLYHKGKLKVELETRVQTDRAGGWDNLKISAKINCNPVPVQSCNSAKAKQVSFENFEDDNDGEGWSEFELEDGEMEHFTKFLGRYGEGDGSPKKNFIVPKIAQAIILEVDFYEIGDWDGTDTAAVYINKELIDLGAFNQSENEGRRWGKSPGGISWVMISKTYPAALGFNMAYNDQKHHVEIVIPATSGFFDDGKLEMVLVTNENRQISDESGGWDNLKISAKMKCF